MRKFIVIFSLALPLVACDESAQTSNPPALRGSESRAIDVSPVPLAEQTTTALAVTQPATSAYEDSRAKTAEARKQSLASFEEAMRAAPEMAITGVVERLPDNLTPQAYDFVTDGLPFASTINEWLEAVFGDSFAREERKLLRAYFNDAEHVAWLKDVVMRRLAYVTFDASTRDWLEAGKVVFKSPLAPYPTDGLWYKSLIRADTLPPAPDFWKAAYGEETFSKDAVYWFMWMHRRQKESGSAAVTAWQGNLSAWLAEIEKRPKVVLPEARLDQ